VGTLTTVDQMFDARHTYATGGIFTIMVTVDDGNGGTDTSTTTAVSQGVGLVDRVLYIIGTDGNDDVKLKFDNRKDELKVDTKFHHGSDGGSDGGHDKKSKGGPGGGHRGPGGGHDHFKEIYELSSIDRVVTFLCEGNDHYDGGGNGHSDGGSDGGADRKANPDTNIGQLVFGGAGRDHLHGGRGNDGLFGGAGDDKIFGRNGHDILVGGDGRDDLKGDRGDDILIGGILDNDVDDVTIIADIDTALAEWASGNLADAMTSLGPIIEDNDRDRLFGKKDDDELFGGLGDLLKP